MIKYGIGCLLAIMLAGASAFAEPPITGDPGATYEDLIREGALVTVLLTDGGRDVNLRLRGVYETTVTLETLSGDNIAYPVSMVREIRVQGMRVDISSRRDPGGVLTADDREIVARAAERAVEIFDESRGNQPVRMVAAMALAASGHERSREGAAYLKVLSESNDVPTAMLPALFLWAIGEPPSDELIREGFLSGNRGARAIAATLAGVMGKDQFIAQVRQLVRDPAIELYPAGAKAAARLNDRQSLPELYEGIRALSDEKAEAAVFALKLIDGPDVRQTMLDMKGGARGLEWFRVIRVLYALGDAKAKEILIDDALRQPAYQRKAALLLADDHVVEAIEYLRDYLDQQEDPNLQNLLYRAQVGIALFEAGDIQAKVILQELLNTEPNDIYARGRLRDMEFKRRTVTVLQQSVCNMIGNQGHRDLLSLLAVPMQSSNPDIALAACTATMQIANPEFGKRLEEARQ